MVNSGKMPLLKALEKYRRLKTVPFHMPGHKKGKGILPKFAGMMRTDAFSLDLTEVPGLDDLHDPCGPIEHAQISAARIFGADRTFFLVNGTTTGIHAAILAICRHNEELIMPRDVHRSVLGACILSGARPVYIPVSFDNHFMIPLPVGVKDVASVLKGHPAAKAVFMVYPSYYGLGGDLKGVAGAAHAFRVPLLVDEAHGAHFAFSDHLPPTALVCGADISIQSTHKTLGAFTQASMLHIKSGLVSSDEVARQLRVLQSTSPSYLLMASLDAAAGQMDQQGGSLVTRAVELAQLARARINSIPGLRCLGEEVLAQSGVVSLDSTKLLISVKGLSITGYQVAEILLRKYRIQVELSDKYNVLCMLSFANTVSDVDKLVAALAVIAAQRKGAKGAAGGLELNTLPAPQVLMSPREAWFSPRKKVPINEAAGKIAAEMVVPYPPGIPVLCPGEKITADVLEAIQWFKGMGHPFHGPADRTLDTLCIVDG